MLGGAARFLGAGGGVGSHWKRYAMIGATAGVLTSGADPVRATFDAIDNGLMDGAQVDRELLGRDIGMGAFIPGYRNVRYLNPVSLKSASTAMSTRNVGFEEAMSATREGGYSRQYMGAGLPVKNSNSRTPYASGDMVFGLYGLRMGQLNYGANDTIRRPSWFYAHVARHA